MVRILPRLTLTLELAPEVMPAYLAASLDLMSFVASAIVLPLSWIGPTWEMLILPSGLMVCTMVASFIPQTSMMSSSPGPST